MTCNKYKSPRRFLIHPPSAPHQTISTCSFIPLTTTDEKSMNARKLISAVSLLSILSSQYQKTEKKNRNGKNEKQNKKTLVREIVRIRFSIFKFHVLFLMQTRVSDSFNQISARNKIMRTLCTERKKCFMVRIFMMFSKILRKVIETQQSSRANELSRKEFSPVLGKCNSIFLYSFSSCFNVQCYFCRSVSYSAVFMESWEPTSQFFIISFLCSALSIARRAPCASNRIHITALPQLLSNCIQSLAREVLRAHLKNCKHMPFD